MSDATARDHRRAAEGGRARCGVLTVSDSRTLATDRGGPVIEEALTVAGHVAAERLLVPDEPSRIREQLASWLSRRDLDVLITTGGTGISSRDGTIEVVEEFLDRVLPGFGELFRMLSFEEVGPAAMLSRATAGLAGETLLFALPGSPAAVRLAMERLIVPELPHLLFERRR